MIQTLLFHYSLNGVSLDVLPLVMACFEANKQRIIMVAVRRHRND